MEHKTDELKSKLMEMYPEIAGNGIDLGLQYDEIRSAWVITYKKGDHSRYAFLDKRDADACMEGVQCIYLGTLIDQYIVDLEREIGLHS